MEVILERRVGSTPFPSAKLIDGWEVEVLADLPAQECELALDASRIEAARSELAKR